MKRQRNIAQMKEQGRFTKANKWRDNRQTTRESIQNNDNKDVPKPWKYNGENARINYHN